MSRSAPKVWKPISAGFQQGQQGIIKYYQGPYLWWNGGNYVKMKQPFAISYDSIPYAQDKITGSIIGLIKYFALGTNGSEGVLFNLNTYKNDTLLSLDEFKKSEPGTIPVWKTIPLNTHIIDDWLTDYRNSTDTKQKELYNRITSLLPYYDSELLPFVEDVQSPARMFPIINPRNTLGSQTMSHSQNHIPYQYATFDMPESNSRNQSHVQSHSSLPPIHQRTNGSSSSTDVWQRYHGGSSRPRTRKGSRRHSRKRRFTKRRKHSTKRR